MIRTIELHEMIISFCHDGNIKINIIHIKIWLIPAIEKESDPNIKAAKNIAIVV